MDLYSALFRHALWPAWERLRQRPTVARLRYLERTQWLSVDALHALQLRSLQALLQHAHKTVPAYRRRLYEAGLDPRALHDLSDLERLPLLRREDVQADRRAFLSDVPGLQLIHKSTSGSTGEPFRFAYNHDSEVWRQAVRLRGYGWAGYQPGQRTVHYWGPPAREPSPAQAAKINLDRALRREVYLDCARQGDDELRAAAARLRELQPQVMVGYTQAMVELGRFVVREGLRDWPAMRVLCGAERLVGPDRAVLEQAFSHPGGVFETYGCREFMLLGAECEEHLGLHLSMETLIVELVDESGRQVAPGEPGQVAVTDLWNYGMPLVRYLTGDMAVATDPSRRCACARGLLRLRSLEGRQSDFLRGADGRHIPGMLLVALFSNLGEQVRQFQAVQGGDGRVELRVVPGPRFSGDVLEGVERRLRAYLGELPLSIQVVSSVPVLPSGKRQYLLREVGPGQPTRAHA